MRLLNPEGISNFENEIKKESFIIACNSDNNIWNFRKIAYQFVIVFRKIKDQCLERILIGCD